MRMLEPRRAPMDVMGGVEGIAVMEDRVLSVLLLALVYELMRAAASLSVIVGRPCLRSRRPCPWGVVFGSRRIHVLPDILWSLSEVESNGSNVSGLARWRGG